MPTLKTYSSKLFKEAVFTKGTRSLRGSYDIIAVDPVQVGHEHQLLMDFHVIDDLNNCRRTVHEPVKHLDNPLIKPENLENGGDPGLGIVLQDPQTGRLRLWLRSGNPKPYDDVLRNCCCESDDGLNWRPAEHKGQAKVSKGGHQFLDVTRTKTEMVLPLPERMRSQGRYGTVYANYLKPEQIPDPETMHHMRFFTAFSEDGIDWTDAPQNPVWVGRSDASNTVVYNPERDVFMIYRRSTINAGQIRRIAYSESKDLISWSQPITVVTRDELDPLWFYSMPVTRYRGVYLGFLWRLDHHPHEDQILPDGKDFKMETELAWSRDGIRWERHPQRPIFLPVSPPRNGRCDWGWAVARTNIVEMGDDLYIYYEGREHLHGPGFYRRDDMRSNVCLATLKRDRFVSLGADTDGGFMLTKPLACTGGRLHINAQTESDGFVCIAVREGKGVRDGEWPDFWRFEKCDPFTGDSLDHVVTWQGHDDMGGFPGEGVVRLHFWLENAKLYSFWFE